MPPPVPLPLLASPAPAGGAGAALPSPLPLLLTLIPSSHIVFCTESQHTPKHSRISIDSDMHLHSAPAIPACALRHVTSIESGSAATWLTHSCSCVDIVDMSQVPDAATALAIGGHSRALLIGSRQSSRHAIVTGALAMHSHSDLPSLRQVTITRGRGGGVGWGRGGGKEGRGEDIEKVKE